MCKIQQHVLNVNYYYINVRTFFNKINSTYNVFQVSFSKSIGILTQFSKSKPDFQDGITRS